MPAFDLGQLVRVSADFQNPSTGALVDPTTVKFDWRVGSGSITTYTYPTTIVKDAVGQYHVDINASTAGTYYWRFYSTGTNQAADEGTFEVASPGSFV